MRASYLTCKAEGDFPLRQRGGKRKGKGAQPSFISARKKKKNEMEPGSVLSSIVREEGRRKKKRMAFDPVEKKRGDDLAALKKKGGSTSVVIQRRKTLPFRASQENARQKKQKKTPPVGWKGKRGRGDRLSSRKGKEVQSLVPEEKRSRLWRERGKGKIGLSYLALERESPAGVGGRGEKTSSLRNEGGGGKSGWEVSKKRELYSEFKEWYGVILPQKGSFSFLAKESTSPPQRRKKGGKETSFFWPPKEEIKADSLHVPLRVKKGRGVT